MKVYRLYHKQILPLDIIEAWAFLSSPWQLNRMTPDFFDIQPTSPVPEAIYAGLVIRYRMRIAGLWSGVWVSEISHCQPYRRFVYDQRVGPFRFLTHEVAFQSSEAGLLVEDHLFYAMPLGWLGVMLHRWRVGQALQAIFQHRGQYLSERWGGALLESVYD